VLALEVTMKVASFLSWCFVTKLCVLGTIMYGLCLPASAGDWGVTWSSDQEKENSYDNYINRTTASYNDVSDWRDKAVHGDRAALASLVATISDARQRTTEVVFPGISFTVFNGGRQQTTEMKPISVTRLSQVAVVAKEAIILVGPAAAEQVCSLLTSTDDITRKTALTILGEIKNPDALGLVIRSACDKQQEVSAEAYSALEKIDPEWEKSKAAALTLPTLVKLLMDDDASVREEAGRVMWRIEPNPSASPIVREAIPKFVQALHDPNHFAAAFSALEEVAPGWRASKTAKDLVPQFLSFLDAGYESTRNDAERILGRIDPAWATSPAVNEAIPLYINTLQYAGTNNAEAALKLLNRFDPQWMTRPAVNDLVSKLVKNLKGEKTYSVASAELLATLKSTEAVEPLIEALRDGDNDLRLSALRALVEIGDQRASDPILACLMDTDMSVRSEAVSALNKFRNPKAFDSLVQLIDIRDTLSDEAVLALAGLPGDRVEDVLIATMNTEVRQVPVRSQYGTDIGFRGDVTDLQIVSCAITGLGKIASPPAIKALAGFSRREGVDPGVRLNAVCELARLGQPGYFEELMRAARHRDLRIRLAAIEEFRTLNDPRSLDIIAGLLRDKDDLVRWYAIRALENMKDARALPALIQLLTNPMGEDKVGVLEALNAINPDWRSCRAAEDALSLIIGKLLDKSEKAATQAKDMLQAAFPSWETDATAKKSVTVFVDALKARRTFMRANAAWALGKIGDSSAIQPLQKQFEAEKDVFVQEAIKVALNTLAQHE
jgi:HEAT repeat protein